jgi:hypothetical protein
MGRGLGTRDSKLAAEGLAGIPANTRNG